VSCPSHAPGVRVLSLLTIVALAAACGDQAGQGNEAVTLSQGESVGNDESDDESDDESGSTNGVLDMEDTDDTTTGNEECTAPFPADPDPEGTLPCGATAPADSWDAEVEWSFEAGESYHVPLVINLTDDDDNGEIDVCDVPDVILLAGVAFGTLYVLDGATGQEHFTLPVNLDPSTTPAVGDIDSDGLPEIVAAVGTPFAASLVAFEHDGTMKWQSDQPWPDFGFSALALADLDGDGGVEILADTFVYDAAGLRQLELAETTITGWGNATTAADLDGDGDLEIVLGRSAFHHDGSPYYDNEAVPTGYPQVANLDDDPEPEVLVQSYDGMSVLEHDGTTKLAALRPTGVVADGTSWIRPATVHDFDGDGAAQWATSSGGVYALYEADGGIVWTAMVQDVTGSAAGTAFDFLGDGVAEAMYGDEHELFVYDGEGEPLLTVPRSSGTLHEYPVVADVDNDGSAEILVVSNEGWFADQTAPALQVIRDVQDRWIPARRIWNQHTYHVTNVREDGTIPAVEPRHWELLNTFRTQAQIEAGGVCQPPVG
jgi:hypothetical protein